jgi:transposase-like protein
MAQQHYRTPFKKALLQFITEPDPFLAMLKWVMEEMMRIEAEAKVGAAKEKHDKGRTTYFSGSRARRVDTRMGTVYLVVPKVRKGGYVPFFISERRRSEQALIAVVQEAFINGVSTRKIERLARAMGIENISASQVSEFNKELDAQAAVRKEWLGASWQRCKVHFIRNILAKVPHREKGRFAAHLKQIWLAPDKKSARRAAAALVDDYEKRFPEVDKKRISSTNGQERLNLELRRRSRVVGVFPSVDNCIRLAVCYLMEYSEDWGSERSYVREDKLNGALDRLHELMVQTAN